MSIEDVVIRKAKREDMLQVYQFIKDLAAHDDMEHHIKINSETLIRDGFDTNPPCFGCFVAEIGTSVIGFALYFKCYSTWVGNSVFLEDLYVHETYRQCGIGKRLLAEIAKVAYNTSKQLDFHVVSENTAAINFYKKLGAVNASNFENWQLFRLEENELLAMIKDCS